MLGVPSEQQGSRKTSIADITFSLTGSKPSSARSSFTDIPKVCTVLHLIIGCININSMIHKVVGIWAYPIYLSHLP